MVYEAIHVIFLLLYHFCLILVETIFGNFKKKAVEITSEEKSSIHESTTRVYLAKMGNIYVRKKSENPVARVHRGSVEARSEVVGASLQGGKGPFSFALRRKPSLARSFFCFEFSLTFPFTLFLIQCPVLQWRRISDFNGCCCRPPTFVYMASFDR